MDDIDTTPISMYKYIVHALTYICDGANPLQNNIDNKVHAKTLINPICCELEATRQSQKIRHVSHYAQI